MPKSKEQYDFVIIGGGIFGAYASLFLAGKGQKVCIIEKEKALLKKASIVNQARLHSGYHYPRSVATAVMSDDNRARFTHEHRDFINFSFEQYYGIDKFGSFTDSIQFERFCQYIDIKCQPVAAHPFFNFDRIERLYATTEYTFDPILIADSYRARLQANDNITIKLYTEVRSAEAKGDHWLIDFRPIDKPETYSLLANQVINATYAGSNAINRLFGLREIDLMHEIAEMVFVTAPPIRNIGLTIMDGPFGSIMPYGLSGLLSLSSVAYTHHKVSYEKLPNFNCQALNPDCRPDFIANCSTCPVRPASNNRKMISQMSRYFTDAIRLTYFTSMYTIKSKLMANYIDDGRPTEISVLQEKPRFYCIFAGKINSIYEIEKIVEL